MIRPFFLWALLLCGIGGWTNVGCIGGVHHHRINSTVEHGEQIADVTGTVDSADFGVVADFRYARLALPFEGHRRQINVDFRNGSQFSVDQVVEIRALRADVPLWSAKDLSDDESETWYPGRMNQRHSLEVWASGSVGVTPIHPASASLGLVYYRYGAVAVRLFAGVSKTPYSGLDRAFIDGTEINRRREGHATGMVAGLEVTLAAGEYALELLRFIVDRDRAGRDVTDRWNR